jgi:fucose permease
LTLELLISIGLFVLVGLESTVNNWIPTYAVQTHVSNKQEAVQFASIFWILESLFRFIFAYFPAKDSTKLTASCLSQLVAGGVCVVVSVLHHPLESAYLSSILYGLTLSMGFPLLLSISQEFGIHFNGDAVSNMMISCTISVGVYSTLTGILMKSTPEMYHYSMLGYSLILLIICFVIMHVLKTESQEANKKGLPLPQD